MVRNILIQVQMTHKETKPDYNVKENPPKATHLAFFDVNILFSLSFRPPLSVIKHFSIYKGIQNDQIHIQALLQIRYH